MTDRILIYVDATSNRLVLYDNNVDRYFYTRVKGRKAMAECRAIIFAFQYLIARYNGEKITIINDSKTFVDAINGESRFNRNDLQAYVKIAQKYMFSLQNEKDIHLIWKNREENIAGVFADLMCNVKVKKLNQKYGLEELNFELDPSNKEIITLCKQQNYTGVKQ